MRRIFLLLLLSVNVVFAQQQELVENVIKTAYEGKSYIYTGGVRLLPPTNGSYRVSGATNGTFYIRPAESVKVPQNIPPSLNQSFVRVENILTAGVKNEDQITPLSNSQKSVQYQYMDGLGRPVQAVSVKSSTSEHDFVKFFNYDQYGRITTDYLPYTSSDQNGAYKSNTLAAQSSFYSNASSGVATNSRPYKEFEFEMSPLNFIKKAYGEGALWKDPTTSTYKSSQSQTQVNRDNTVRRWILSTAGLPESSSYYPEGTLSVLISTSEESYVHKVYTDFRGNVVMIDRQGMQTQYVYDEMGLLRFVMPPELGKLYPSSVASAQPDQLLLNKWAFQYKYDTRKRLIQEKGPGKDNDWVFYIYDQWDRPVLKQDGAQRAKSPKEWSFVKYDALNRPVMTGILKTTLADYAAMSGAVTGGRYETENTSSFGYTLTGSFPSTSVSGISSIDVLAISYYDDYSFLTISGWSDNNTAYNPDAGLNSLATPKGLVTGSKIKVLNQSTWLTSTRYYNSDYEPIQVINRTNLSAVPDRVTNTYNFAGWLVQSIRKHRNYETSATLTITEDYEYDHAGRLKKIFHQLDANPRILLTQNNYNELGQLIERNLHSVDNGATFLQSVDYRYNIRGWLTSINNSQLSNDNGVTNNDTNDLFGLNLVYNEENLSVAGVNSNKLYDGRISAARWKINNQKDSQVERVYAYDYDSQRRLQQARFAAKNGTTWTGEAGMYNVEGVQYDDNGNITKLKRYAKSNGAKTLIDDLTYGYDVNGNQLTTVEEGQGNNFGYPNATTSISPELTYDKNGNLISDLNSQITSVTYNYLNLPERIVIDLPNTTDDKIVEYTYDASGYVLKKVYWKGSTLVRTVDYANGIQYYDQKLGIVFTPGGRATLNRLDGKFEYEYFIKDHLSNTRVVFGNVHGTDVYKATMEVSQDSKESQQFSNISSSRAIGNNYTPASIDIPAPDRTAKLLGYGGGSIVGPAKMLQVKAGDKISMEVFARYTSTVSSSTVVTNLVSAVTGAYGIVNGGETQQAYQALNNNLPLYSGQVVRGTNAPKAYLFYILFDNTYTYKQFGYAAVDNTALIKHQLLSLSATMPNDGYLYMYIANESNVSTAEVYFDDFKITHEKQTYALRVTESTDYDPYGLMLDGTKYVDESRIVNNYKYQGEFAEFDSWTGWNRFSGRGNYDSRLGRWASVDPKQGLFADKSPYNAMLNNPVNTIDPDGECPWCAIAVISGIANVASNWDKISQSGSWGQAVIQGAQYFAVGAVSGAVATVNPLAAASIMSAGNAGVDLANGRTPSGQKMMTDFAFTFVGAKADQAYTRATKQLYGELDALQAKMAAQNAAKGAAKSSVEDGSVTAHVTGEEWSKTVIADDGTEMVSSGIAYDPVVIGTSASVRMENLKSLKPTHFLTLSKTKMQNLVNQIREEGMTESIKYVVHNGEMYIVDGHHRYFAAQKIGLSNVPVQEVALPYMGYETVADLALTGTMPGYWKYIK
jgi:RHS repeat-associated protein